MKYGYGSRKDSAGLFEFRLEPRLIEVPPLPYLALDGVGNRESEAIRAGIKALHSAAVGVHACLDLPDPGNVTSAPLEGLWWLGDPDPSDKTDHRVSHWTAMMMIPDEIGEEEFARTLRNLKIIGQWTPAHDKLEFRVLEEGLCVQALHVGSYEDRTETVSRMKDFGTSQGYSPNGKLHEIYLSDPRNITPETFRVGMRFPVC